MEPTTMLVIVVALIVASIIGYRVVEGLLPKPPTSPEAPRSEFQILTDAVNKELARLHDELTSITSGGPMYEAVIKEIGRLNEKLIDLYEANKPDAGGQS